MRPAAKVRATSANPGVDAVPSRIATTSKPFGSLKNARTRLAAKLTRWRADCGRSAVSVSALSPSSPFSVLWPKRREQAAHAPRKDLGPEVVQRGRQGKNVGGAYFRRRRIGSRRFF